MSRNAIGNCTQWDAPSSHKSVKRLVPCYQLFKVGRSYAQRSPRAVCHQRYTTKYTLSFSLSFSLFNYVTKLTVRCCTRVHSRKHVMGVCAHYKFRITTCGRAAFYYRDHLNIAHSGKIFTSTKSRMQSEYYKNNFDKCIKY